MPALTVSPPQRVHHPPANGQRRRTTARSVTRKCLILMNDATAANDTVARSASPSRDQPMSNHLAYSAISMTARRKCQLGENYFSQGHAGACTTHGSANASFSSPNFNKTWASHQLPHTASFLHGKLCGDRNQRFQLSMFLMLHTTERFLYLPSNVVHRRRPSHTQFHVAVSAKACFLSTHPE